MKRLKVCLINPKFEPSYRGFDYALPLYPGNIKSTMIPGALPHLAGLIRNHDVCLIDENVEAIDFDSLRRFDIVGLTGMIVQKRRMLEILQKVRCAGAFTVVGGAYASVDQEFFDGYYDVLFCGEADETWPEFVDRFAAGKSVKRFYKQRQPTDLTKLPKPRFDLLKTDRYATGAVQFSRGCPFLDRSLKKVGVVYCVTLSSTGVVTSVVCSGSRNSRIAASRIGIFINLPGKECQAGSGCLIQASCTVPWPAAFPITISQSLP